MGKLLAQRSRTSGSGTEHITRPDGSAIDSSALGLTTAFAVAKGLKPVSCIHSQGKLPYDLRTEHGQLKTIESLYTILRKRNPKLLKGEPTWTKETNPGDVLEWILKRWNEEFSEQDDWFITEKNEVGTYIEVPGVDQEFRCVALWFLPHLQQHNYAFYKLFIGVVGCVGRLYNLARWDGYPLEEASKEWLQDLAETEDDKELMAEAAAMINYYDGSPAYWSSKLYEEAFTTEQALKAIDSYKGRYPAESFKTMINAAYYAILHHDGNTIDDFDFLYWSWQIDDAGVTLDQSCRFAWYFWDRMWECVEEQMDSFWNNAGHTPITQGVILTKKEPHGKVVLSDTIKLLFRFMEAGNRACHDYYKKFPGSRIKLITNDDEGTK